MSSDSGRNVRLILERFQCGVSGPAEGTFYLAFRRTPCMTRDDYDFAKELTSFYELPPGEYVIRLRPDWQTGINLCSREEPEQFHKQPDDLTFIVRKP